MRRPPPLAAVPLALVWLALPAVAQETTVSGDVGPGLTELPQAGFWDGGGVLIGDSLIFHPRFELTTAFQTNVFYSDGDGDVGGPVLGAGVARVGVGGTLGTKEPGRMELEGGQGANQAVAFRGEAALTWNQFISSEPVVRDQSDLGVSLAAHLQINPQGELTLGLRDGYTRYVNPGVSLSNRFDRDKNDLAANLTWKPGGGALQAYLEYKFTLDLFESSDLSFDSRLMHNFELGARWRWLPMTEFSLSASLGIVSPNDETFKPSSNPFKVWAGASTLITPVIGVVLKAGYGNGLYSAGPSVSTYLALVELRYAIGPTIRLAAGYSHDFADALIGNAYLDHILYARFGLQLQSRLQIRLKGEGRFRSYVGIMDTGGVVYCGDAACGKFRDDFIVGLDAAIEYQFTNWLFASLVYTLQVDRTDFFALYNQGMDPGSYVWQEIGGRVSARF